MTRRAFDRMNKAPCWQFKRCKSPTPPQKKRKAIMQQPQANSTPQEDLWPLAVVAFEIGMRTRDLESRCNGAVHRNAVGLRCISGQLVRELVAERDAECDAEHARQHQQRMKELALAEQRREQTEAETRAREARAEKQKVLVESGLSALEVMKADDGVYEAEIAASDERTAEYFSGGWTYHPITPEKWA
jgi:hypothetical protein